MSEALRLFDPSPWGGETTPCEKRRTTLTERSTAVTEPHVEPWLLIRNRGGVFPFFHLVRARADTGAVVAVCGIMGNQISNVGVDQMVRCPGCDVGSQVDQLSML